jgi:hypothetical protein
MVHILWEHLRKRILDVIYVMLWNCQMQIHILLNSAMAILPIHYVDIPPLLPDLNRLEIRGYTFLPFIPNLIVPQIKRINQLQTI